MSRLMAHRPILVAPVYIQTIVKYFSPLRSIYVLLCVGNLCTGFQMDIDSTLRKARKLSLEGKAREARELYNQVLRVSPENAEAVSELSALKMESNQVCNLPLSQAQVDDLLKLMHSSEYHLALETAQQLIVQYPANELLYNLLGVILTELGKLDEALIAYKESIRLQPDYFHAHSNLGNLYVAVGKLDLAISSYKAAIEISPEYVQAHCNLANVWNLVGNHEAAEKSALKAIKLNPNIAEAHNNLGIAYTELQNKEAAIKAFTEAIRINPQLAQVHSNLAGVLSSQCQYNQALQYYEQAIKLDPDFGDAHGAMGATLRALGRVSDGLAAEMRGWGVITFDIEHGIEVRVS